MMPINEYVWKLERECVGKVASETGQVLTGDSFMPLATGTHITDGGLTVAIRDTSIIEQ